MRWRRGPWRAPRHRRRRPPKDFERALDAAPGRDIARLVSDLDRKSPAWPAAALKLAASELHLGDRPHARDLASDILSTDGQGPSPTARAGWLKAAQEPGPLNPRLLGIVAAGLTGDLKGVRGPGAQWNRADLRPAGRGSLMVEVVDTRRAGRCRGRGGPAGTEGRESPSWGAGIAEGLAAATRAQQLGIPSSPSRGARASPPLASTSSGTCPPPAPTGGAEYAQKKLNAKSFGILHPDSTTATRWRGTSGRGRPRAEAKCARSSTTRCADDVKPFVQQW